MTRKNRFAAILVGAILSVPTVALLSSFFIRRMIEAEYASGARTSTNGDSPMIPVVGVTVAWTVALLAGAAIWVTVRLVRRAARGDAG